MKNSDESFIFNDQEILNPIVPETIEEAIECLYRQMKKEDLDFIKNPENGYFMCHHGLGGVMRNNWDLWKNDNVLCKDIINRFGLSHGDDKSGLILAGLFAKVRNRNILNEITKTAEGFKKHWLAQKIDPLTMEKIK